MKERTIQELYDELYLEVVTRARRRGDKLPTEVEIFKLLHNDIQRAVALGYESPDALVELSEVQSFHIREEEAERRKHEVDEALRHGYVLDLDAIK
jgi:hypothetical protein